MPSRRISFARLRRAPDASARLRRAQRQIASRALRAHSPGRQPRPSPQLLETSLDHSIPPLRSKGAVLSGERAGPRAGMATPSPGNVPDRARNAICHPRGVQPRWTSGAKAAGRATKFPGRGSPSRPRPSLPSQPRATRREAARRGRGRAGWPYASARRRGMPSGGLASGGPAGGEGQGPRGGWAGRSRRGRSARARRGGSCGSSSPHRWEALACAASAAMLSPNARLRESQFRKSLPL